MSSDTFGNGSHIGVEIDAGVCVLTIDDPLHSANVINAAFLDALTAALDSLEVRIDEIDGFVVASAKSTFCTGGDLNEIIEASAENAADLFAHVDRTKAVLRRLEMLGRPIVATINGAALGGGLEVALACHHRIAVVGAPVGLPEVNLGLLPGGGGVARTVRMLGIHPTLAKVLLSGRQYRGEAAVEVGLVDELVESPDELLAAARAWIAAKPVADQPWDRPDYRIPGGDPSDHNFAMGLSGLATNLRRDLKGVDLPAPRAILAAAVEGSQVDFDNAQRIESRYFVELATGQIAKNMIRGGFLDLQEVNSGAARPDGYERASVDRVGVLGAGLMGSAIAFVCAEVGIEVVLKDVSLEVAERGKGYAQKVLDRAVERGRRSEAEAATILARITPTAEAADLAGCEAVIEAVLETTEVKQAVFAEAEEFIKPDALLASNTSSIPITELAEGVARPADFVGMHFFSPVDQMQLVELVVGERTSDATLARAFDLARQMKKTPIVVNDSRGFFTSRVIESFLMESIAMVGEGCHPRSVERAASQAGYPVPPLQLMDQLTLTLLRQVSKETRAAQDEADASEEHPGALTLDRVIDDLGRHGRAAGGGFYEYADGKRVGIWPGLIEAFETDSPPIPIEDMRERMLFSEALETVRCFDEGVLRSAADANVGSLLGIGYPRWTGGTVQYMNGYPGGLAGFVARADELAERYGARFEPPSSLRATAEAGDIYPALERAPGSAVAV
jgi:3-hydroxyacyl-CoA dehydrogenase/enoyl-CoA hydratase/3-hydroxybutyryl-CoA epimerase